MGFRARKSIQIVPGVRMNFSKSGIGYSAGVKGYRVTKRADGRVQKTASIPGTGVSHVKTSGTARSRSKPSSSARGTPAAPRPSARATKPGMFAPKGEKELYKALQASDVARIESVGREHADFTLAAATIAGALTLASGNRTRAGELFDWVFATEKEPLSDPFMAKYVTAAHVSVEVVPGVTAELPLDRAGLGLTLAEIHQEAGDAATAAEIVEQLEPTAFAALSLAELYSELGRHGEVVEMTDGMTNGDDSTALLCVFRGVAMREQGYFDAARESFKEALKSKKRSPVVRHRAYLERSRCYEAKGTRAMARKDLERILAEDSTYEGLAEALATLADGTR